MAAAVSMLNFQSGNTGLALLWGTLVYINLKNYTNIQRREKEALADED